MSRDGSVCASRPGRTRRGVTARAATESLRSRRCFASPLVFGSPGDPVLRTPARGRSFIRGRGWRTVPRCAVWFSVAAIGYGCLISFPRTQSMGARNARFYPLKQQQGNRSSMLRTVESSSLRASSIGRSESSAACCRTKRRAYYHRSTLFQFCEVYTGRGSPLM